MNSSNSPTFKEGLTFDDVLLVPQFSEILPKETELKTFFTRNIKLNIPVIFGVLTDLNINQAIARSSGDKNKGIECAIAAIQMANL